MNIKRILFSVALMAALSASGQLLPTPFMKSLINTQQNLASLQALIGASPGTGTGIKTNGGSGTNNFLTAPTFYGTATANLLTVNDAATLQNGLFLNGPIYSVFNGSVILNVGASGLTIGQAGTPIQFASPIMPLIGRTWYVATNGSDLSGAVGVREKPFMTMTNVLAQWSTGDTLKILNGNYSATQSFYLPPFSIIDASGLSRTEGFLTNAIRRHAGNLQDALLMGHFYGNTVKGLKMVGVGTTNAVQNAPMIGLIGDTGIGIPSLGFTNLFLDDVFITNCNVGFYLRATNPCSVFARNCEIWTKKSAVTVLYDTHNTTWENCILAGVGPNPIPGDSGNTQAHAVDLKSGTNNFTGCTFIYGNPTNDTPDIAAATTNAIGLYVENSTDGHPSSVSLRNCKFVNVNTNAAAGVYVFDIANGFDPLFSHEAAVVSQIGCDFSWNRVYGPIVSSYLPVTNGVRIIANTNLLYDSGVSVVNFPVWGLSTSVPLVYTNTGSSGWKVVTNAGHWEIRDDIDDAAWTNASLTLTGTTFRDTSTGLATNTFKYLQTGQTNGYDVMPFGTGLNLAMAFYGGALFYSGSTNIGNLATTLVISIGHTMPSTNYVPSVTFFGGALAGAVTPTFASRTTTAFTLNLSAGIAGGENLGWSVIYSP